MSFPRYLFHFFPSIYLFSIQLRVRELMRFLSSPLLQTEMVSPSDKRRQYISGFSGSAGTAVVTDKQAALWVDGRYYLQADQQLDCQWLVMKSGQDYVKALL